jgi:hypothetical protein
VSESTITTFPNAIIIQIPGIGDSASCDGNVGVATSSLAMTGLSIPVTGSMSAGFTIGFIKG